MYKNMTFAAEVQVPEAAARYFSESSYA